MTEIQDHERLLLVRRRKKLSQHELISLVGSLVSVTIYSQIERGLRPLPDDLKAKLFEVLGIDK